MIDEFNCSFENQLCLRVVPVSTKDFQSYRIKYILSQWNSMKKRFYPHLNVRAKAERIGKISVYTGSNRNHFVPSVAKPMLVGVSSKACSTAEGTETRVGISAKRWKGQNWGLNQESNVTPSMVMHFNNPEGLYRLILRWSWVPESFFCDGGKPCFWRKEFARVKRGNTQLICTSWTWWWLVFSESSLFAAKMGHPAKRISDQLWCRCAIFDWKNLCKAAPKIPHCAASSLKRRRFGSSRKGGNWKLACKGA